MKREIGSWRFVIRVFAPYSWLAFADSLFVIRYFFWFQEDMMALNISLNGSNYVSEKTRGAFENALQDAGSEVQEAKGRMQELGNRMFVEGNGGEKVEGAVEKVEDGRQAAEGGAQGASLADGAMLDSLDHALAQSYEHQTLTMRVHEQYLHNQSDYARIFSELMQQQGAIFSGSLAHGNGAPQHVEVTVSVLDTLARSMTRFHDLQEQTLDVHRQFLTQQSEYARAAIQLLQQRTGTTQEAGNRVQETGYRKQGAGSKVQEGIRLQDAGSHAPAPGNGKRSTHVKMAVASFDSPVPAPSSDPTSSPLSILLPDPVPSSPPIPDPLPSAPSEDAAPAPSPHTSYSTLLTSSLLAIVSDKTGYPADMLDLGMDMESDLGIDSIKRVEILGALQEAHPDLPEVSTEVLSEMRTLGQIVERLQEGSEAQEAGIGELVGSAKKA